MIVSTSQCKYYCDGKPITEQEYDHIRSIIAAKPTPPDGYDYRLNDALEWEQYELPPAEPEDLTDTEALSIITGGESNA